MADEHENETMAGESDPQIGNYHEAYAPTEFAAGDDEIEPAAVDDSDAPVHLDDVADVADVARPPQMDEDGDIRADNVTINQGGARDIEATTVSITQGGAAQVHADQMSLSQGGVALARVDSLTVEEGGSALAVVAESATVREGSNVFLLVAGRVDGDGRPVLDWRSALAAGAGLGIALSVIRRILR